MLSLLLLTAVTRAVGPGGGSDGASDGVGLSSGGTWTDGAAEWLAVQGSKAEETRAQSDLRGRKDAQSGYCVLRERDTDMGVCSEQRH